MFMSARDDIRTLAKASPLFTGGSLRFPAPRYAAQLGPRATSTSARTVSKHGFKRNQERLLFVIYRVLLSQCLSAAGFYFKYALPRLRGHFGVAWDCTVRTVICSKLYFAVAYLSETLLSVYCDLLNKRPPSSPPHTRNSRR